MERLVEYELVVNNQLMGIIMSGTVVIAVVVLLMFYYFYIERTKLVRYVIYYFLSALVGLVASSFRVSKSLGQDYAFGITEIHAFEIFGEYLSIFTIYLLAMYLLRERRQWLSWLLFLLLLAMNGAGFRLGLMLPFMSLYVVTIVSIISVRSFMLGRRKYCFYSVAWGASMFIAQIPLTPHLIILDLQWLVDQLMVIFLVVFFTRRYREIHLERNSLHLALTRDAMTGAASKSYFYEQMRSKRDGVLLFIDVNRFKWINDTYGHLAGDRLLCDYAAMFNERADIIFARFGGDEFTIYSSRTDELGIHELVRSLKTAFDEVLTAFDQASANGVGISIGVAEIHDGRWEEALSFADECMYKAKEKGNNMVMNCGKGVQEWIG